MTETIQLHKVNEAFIQVECERGLAQELSEHFTFHVPGYQYTPAYKSRVWDGKIRLLDLRNFQIYHGLTPYIKEFCTERGYECLIDDDVNSTDAFAVIEAKEFVDTLKLPHVVRDYQLKSFITAIRNKRLLLLSPTASGKSLILYLIVRHLLINKMKKGLLIVPTTSLCYQMFTDFEDYSNNDNEFIVEDEVSIIMGGKDKNPKVDRLKVTLENNKICYLKPNQRVNTKRGVILAKNLTIEDDLL